MSTEGAGGVAQRWQRWRLVLLGLLCLTTVLFAAGVVSPLFTVEKFVFIENTFTLVSALGELWRQQRYGLLLLVGGFSLVLPLLKLLVLYRALRPPSGVTRVNRYLRWIHEYGRWSMLDVFVVALMVVSLKLGVFFEVRVHYGLYLFTAAIVLTMVITAIVVRRYASAEHRIGVSP